MARKAMQVFGMAQLSRKGESSYSKSRISCAATMLDAVLILLPETYIVVIDISVCAHLPDHYSTLTIIITRLYQNVHQHNDYKQSNFWSRRSKFTHDTGQKLEKIFFCQG